MADSTRQFETNNPTDETVLQRQQTKNIYQFIKLYNGGRILRTQFDNPSKQRRRKKAVLV